MKQEEERARQERIRQRAYQLWEAEGRPEGRQDVHWDQASELVAIEENGRLATRSLADSVRNLGPEGEPVEPLEAVKNLGDFPTLRDQGEEEVFPHEPQPDPRAPKTGEIVGQDLTTGEHAFTQGAKPSRAKRDKRDASAAPARQAAAIERNEGSRSTGAAGAASKRAAGAKKSASSTAAKGSATGAGGKGGAAATGSATGKAAANRKKDPTARSPR